MHRFDDSTELKVALLASSEGEEPGSLTQNWYTKRAFHGEIQWRIIMGDNARSPLENEYIRQGI